MPRDPDLHYRRAVLLLALGRPREAGAALDVCESLIPAPSALARRTLDALRQEIRGKRP